MIKCFLHEGEERPEERGIQVQRNRRERRESQEGGEERPEKKGEEDGGKKNWHERRAQADG